MCINRFSEFHTIEGVSAVDSEAVPCCYVKWYIQICKLPVAALLWKLMVCLKIWWRGLMHVFRTMEYIASMSFKHLLMSFLWHICWKFNVRTWQILSVVTVSMDKPCAEITFLLGCDAASLGNLFLLFWGYHMAAKC